MTEHINHNLNHSARASSHVIDADHMDLSDLFSTIKYQKKWIFLVLLIGSVLTMLAVLMVTTKYTAQSSVLLNAETQQTQGESLKNIAKSVTLDIGFVLTEIEILKSRDLIQKVVEKLNLHNDPEFNLDLSQKPDAMGSISNIEKPAFKQSLSHDLIEFNIKEKAQDTKIINEVLDKISIKPVVGSSVIRIHVTSQSPEKSAKINNTLIQEYISKRQNDKLSTRNKFADWLENTINILQNDIAEAEKKTEKYRVRYNLNLNDKSLLSMQEISNLQKQKIEVEKDLTNIRTQINQIQILDDAVIANLANSALIRSLKSQQVALQSNISELSKRYGPKHPIMIEKQAELSAIRSSVEEQKSIAQGELQNKMNALQGNISDIKQKISQAEKKSNTENNALIKYQEMKAEIEVSKNALRDLKDKYSDVRQNNNILSESAQVISYATIPETPSTPNKKLLTFLGLIVSTFMAFLFAFLNEKFSNKFRNSEDLEKEFQIPCLTEVPYVSTGWKKSLIEHCLSKPSAPIIEVIRNLNITIKNLHDAENKNPKIILLTSSQKNEGKTSVAYLMAMTAAKSGEKTILIEANLKNPILQSITKSTQKANIVDVLTNQKNLADVIEKNDSNDLHIIYGGSIPHNSYNLLSSQKMTELCNQLKENYDLVIIDSPSCQQAADARLLERLSDLCLYCVKYNHTAKKVIKNTIKHFIGPSGSKTAFIITHTK